MKSNRVLYLLFFWFIILLNSCERNASVSTPSNQKIHDTSVKDATEEVNKQLILGDPIQIEFHKKMSGFKRSYEMAQNAIEKFDITKEALTFMTNFFLKNRLEHWQGKIKSIGVHGAGDEASVIIESSLAGVTIAYMKGQLGIGSIKRESQVFIQLRNLKDGDIVIFSGKFNGPDASVLNVPELSYQAKSYLNQEILDIGVDFTSISLK